MTSNVTYLPWVEPNTVPPTDMPETDIPSTDVDTPAVHDDAQYDIETDLLRALTRRDMSTSEVRQWLVTREIDEATADAWLERLGRLGYVNDERMAEHLVAGLMRRGGKGRTALLRALTERGIDRVTAQSALAALDQETELRAATELVAQRCARSAHLDPAILTRRLEGFLARRGYSSSVIREAIRANLSYPD